jgi:hypothetical protein
MIPIRSVLLAIYVLAVQAAASCYADMRLISHPISGIVVDATTGRPVPEAIVVATWSGGWSGVATSGTRCANGIAVKSDQNGTFLIPEWTMRHPNLDSLVAVVSAYKVSYENTARGFVSADPKTLMGFIPRGEIEVASARVRVGMQPVQGDDAARAEYLLGFLNSTDCREGSNISGMNPLYKSVRNEIVKFPSAIRDYKKDPEQRSLLEIIDYDFLSRTEGPNVGRSGSDRDVFK